jgi:hypothetical protein
MVDLLTAAFTVSIICVILSSLGFHRAIRKHCITNCKYFNGSLNMFIGEDKLPLELFSVYFLVALIGFFFKLYLTTIGILIILIGLYFIVADGYIYYLLTERYRK